MRNLREDWPEVRPRARPGGSACRCDRKRRVDRYLERLANQSLSTALRHAQDPWEEAWEATPPTASTVTLGPIAPVAWSEAATVSDLKAARKPAFETKGRNRVYRITRDGQELYVGMVHGAKQSVAGRIRQHHEGSVGTASQRLASEEKWIRHLLKDKLTTTFVQYADVVAPDGHLDGPKYLHAVELLLATKLKPHVYIRHVVSFEDEDDADDF